MSYPTLDYITDLSVSQRAGAPFLTFAPAPANAAGWDNEARVSRFDEYANLRDLFAVTLTQGGSYDIGSHSFFDPFQIVLYDQDGNAIKISTEGPYGSDYIFGFVAPYTGTYYIDAGWNPGSYHTYVSLSVYEDIPSAATNGGSENLSGSRVFAGPGNDSVTGTAGEDYLRGEDGNDVIVGGGAFDDLHGNAGNDTVSGGDGDDWVVGGKDNDHLKGEWGDDIVYGNLGDDTCEGGGGDDIVRGGQGNDLLLGGDGRDWISGDRGNDTITGGAGADTFNTFADAGLDRVTDFNRAEGDVVRVEGGVYTWAQVGGDVEITIAGSAKLTLIGVQASSLTDGWIVSA